MMVDVNNLNQALKTISGFCQEQDKCENCILYNGYDCSFYNEDLSPYAWADEFEEVLEKAK